MALQLGALRDALKEAGASDAAARAAAEEVAAYENRLTELSGAVAALRAHMDQQFAALRAYVDQQLTELRADLERQIAELRSDVERQIAELRSEVRALAARVTMLQWVVGFMVALQIAILVKLFVR